MISRLYGMWMGIQQNQEQRARQNLMSFLSMYPNATDDQKRAAIQQYQQQTAHLNPSFRMTFPTEAIPGPVTQAATPGVAPEAPGTAQNAPVGPSGGAPLVPGGPSVSGGVLRESPSSEGVAATPEVRGPSPGTEIAVPRSDPLQQTGADNPAWDSFLKQNVSPQAYNFLRTLPIGQALQQDPMLKMLYFGKAGGGGGAAPPAQPGGQIPGQPGAPAGMTPQQAPAQGQPANQAQGPEGVFVFGHTTWGDVDPSLKDNPAFQGIASQQVPSSFWNYNTGQFNYTAAQTSIDRVQNEWDKQHGTPFQQSGRNQAEAARVAAGAGKLVQQAIASAQKQGASGSVDQKQIHNTLQAAKDRLQALADQYPDSEVVQQAVKDGLAQIAANSSDTLYAEGGKSRLTMASTAQRMQLAQKNYELNVARLGISQEQASIAAARLGISQGEYALRVQQIANNSILQQYDAAQSRGDTATMKRLQPQADSVMRRIGVTGPYSGRGKPSQASTKTPQTLDDYWNQARSLFPTNVTDAMQRMVHGTASDKDKALVASTSGAAAVVKSILQKMKAGGGANTPTPTPWTPPAGAVRGKDRKTGKVVWKVGSEFYDENGNLVK